MSVKPTLTDTLKSVRQPWIIHGLSDGLIAGRADGQWSRLAKPSPVLSTVHCMSPVRNMGIGRSSRRQGADVLPAPWDACAIYSGTLMVPSWMPLATPVSSSA